MLFAQAGGGGKRELIGAELPLGKVTSYEAGWWGWLHSNMNVLNATELSI